MFNRAESTGSLALHSAEGTPSSGRGRLVSTAAWLMLVVCVAGSVVAATAQRSSVRAEARAAFRATASDVAASMASALRRDTDFVAIMGSTLAQWPGGMSNLEFRRWLASTQAMRRYPGGLGYAFIANVPAAQLGAFGRQLLADPPVPTLGARRLTVIPPGQRADYCIIRLGGGSSVIGISLGQDQCAGAIQIAGQTLQSGAAYLGASRDSGQVAVGVVDAAYGICGAAAPVYAGGETPPTVTGRRAALLGWAGGSFSGPAIVTAAGGVTTGFQVQITHRNAGQPPTVVATAGSAKAGSPVRVVPVNANGSWTVRVSGSAPSSGLSATAQFWIILLVGLGLSALLFAFVRVLARSRSRALRQVARKTAELRHLSLHDGLTGLPNRALILDRVERALARARREHSQLAVMFLDLDGFKDVNDMFGHAAGDELLCAVSARLSGLLRDSDTVGRLGGDEFVVLAEGDSLDAGPEVIADRIREVLATPFVLGASEDVSAQIHTSVGIATGLRPSADDLLRDADIALYEAKHTGRNRVVLFATEMHTAAEQRHELQNDLRQALSEEQLFLLYQPTFDLATNSVTGVEALLRWQHPTRGLVMPDEFIPLAEETGLIVPIGAWVVRQACHQGADWQRHDNTVGVSVNVSARQLDNDAGYVADVRAALSDSGLRPDSLTLEITETALMRDADASAGHLRALKDLGVRIAIDDFGTGYSSLGYLRQFPVDSMKIDRSFISGIADNPEAGAIMHTLVQLGKALGIETLAEGIEESGQLNRLQREACDSGQGYLFARPLTANDVSQCVYANQDAQQHAPAAR